MRAALILALAALWALVWLVLILRTGVRRWMGYVSSSVDLLTVAAVFFNWSCYPEAGLLPTQLKFAVGWGMLLTLLILTGLRFDWRSVALVSAEALASYVLLIAVVVGAGRVEFTPLALESFTVERVNLVDLGGRIIVLAVAGVLMSTLVYRAERLVQHTGSLTAMGAQLRQFVSSAVAEDIEAGRADLDLRGQRRSVTLLFCDIRDFTKLSERLEPEGLLDLLNRFYERVTEQIFLHHGTLDK